MLRPHDAWRLNVSIGVHLRYRADVRCRRLPAACLVPFSILAGCGRCGYQSQGAMDGAESDRDGSSAQDAGFPDDCPIMVVTTASDEEDADETSEPPHQGDGLSLREALTLANAQAGPDCIAFAAPMTILVPGASLPSSLDPEGVIIDGAGNVVITGVETPGSKGLEIGGGESVLRGLELTAFETCIQAKSPRNQLGPGLEVHDCDVGIKIDEDENHVRGVISQDNTLYGIQVQDGTGNTEIVQTILSRNGDGGLLARANTNLVIRHTTMTTNGASGINVVLGSDNLVIENSIFVEHSSFGVRVDSDDSIDSLDYCVFFANAVDDCRTCSIGTHSIVEDPQLVDPMKGDYSLAPGSPAMDRGIDTGLDVNGAAPGLFNGDAPDIGAVESP